MPESKRYFMDWLVFFRVDYKTFRYWLKRKEGIRQARFNIILGEHIKAHMKLAVDDIFSPPPIYAWLRSQAGNNARR